MKVKDVIQTLGGEAVMVGPDESIAEAARRIHAAGKGLAVVLTEDGGLSGILSVIDINRGVAEHAGRLGETKVRELMNPSVCTCGAADDVEAALETMAEAGIRHLPVVEDGKLIGLVGLRGLLQCGLEAARIESEDLRRYVLGVDYG